MKIILDVHDLSDKHSDILNVPNQIPEISYHMTINGTSLGYISRQEFMLKNDPES